MSAADKAVPRATLTVPIGKINKKWESTHAGVLCVRDARAYPRGPSAHSTVCQVPSRRRGCHDKNSKVMIARSMLAPACSGSLIKAGEHDGAGSCDWARRG
jgi:hypothetical protein